MPRTPAQDTPGRRELKVLDSVSRRLDELSDAARVRVIDWLDTLIDAKAEDAEAELRAMKILTVQVQTLDSAGRERVVRWLIEHYGKAEQPTPDENGPVPL